MSDIPSQDDLIRYVLGHLPQDEARLIAKRCRRDPLLKERLAVVESLCADMTSPNQPSSALARQLPAVRYWVATLAALVLVAFVTTESLGVTKVFTTTLKVVIPHADSEIILQIPFDDATELFVDDQRISSAAVLAEGVLHVTPGTHRLRLVQQGRLVMEQTIAVQSGEAVAFQTPGVGEHVEPQADLQIKHIMRLSYADEFSELRALVFSEDDRALILACGGYAEKGRVLRIDVKQQTSTILANEPSGVPAVTASTNGKLVAYTVWNSNELVARNNGAEILRTKLTQVGRPSLTPDGRLLAVGGEDGSIGVWDMAERKLIRTWSLGTTVHGVLIAPDGKSLIVVGGHWQPWGHSDSYGEASIWTLEGQVVQHLQGHEATVLTAAVAPDRRVVVTAGVDRSIRLWDLASGKLVRTIWAHDNVIEAVAFSPNGLLLASGSWDGTVKLWEPRSGKLLATLVRHQSHVKGVGFSSDGKLFASCGADGAVNLWQVGSTEESKKVQESQP